MRLLDITPCISPRLGVFPGDTPFRLEVLRELARGDNFGLSAVHSTVHLGAHADAPCHYPPGGPGIEACALEPYLGPCEVVRVPLPRGSRVRPGDLPPATPRAPRILFRTDSFPDPEAWNPDFCSLSPELVAVLAERGVRLVGIDTPSIDPQEDRELRSHRAVGERGLAILEGLMLGSVEPGLYTLIALPLPLEGADASPVRAVLLDDGGRSLAGPLLSPPPGDSSSASGPSTPDPA